MPNRKKSEGENNHPENISEKPVQVMCKSLDKFGPSEVLHLLTANAHNDPICLNLLTQFPTVVSLSEFLHTLPTIKVSKRLFKKLEREHCIL